MCSGETYTLEGLVPLLFVQSVSLSAAGKVSSKVEVKACTDVQRTQGIVCTSIVVYSPVDSIYAQV